MNTRDFLDCDRLCYLALTSAGIPHTYPLLPSLSLSTLRVGFACRYSGWVISLLLPTSYLPYGAPSSTSLFV